MTDSKGKTFSAPFPFLRDALRTWHKKYGAHEAMEIVYRELLGRELQRLSIEDRFFPVGAAANHGLLYLVLRCYLELPLTRILDVGAGQTSLLLDALNRKLGKCEIVTLEHDAAWAERIGTLVTHAVLRRDLVDMRPGGQLTRMHDTSGIEGPFQLIIMDAPPGSDRYSRLGLLHLMQTVMDRRDFVAILDDVDRGPEWQTVRVCRQWLGAENIPFQETQIRAAKRQWLCAGGEMIGAAYF